MGIAGIQFQRDLQLLIQNIEQKLERFRQGPAQRIPDALNAFAYKVRNFLIGGSTKGPSIVAAQRQQTPTVAEPPLNHDADLLVLQRGSFRRRKEVPEEVPEPPQPKLVVIASEPADPGPAPVLQDVKEGMARTGQGVTGKFGRLASEIGDTIEKAFGHLMGSPPPPPPPPMPKTYAPVVDRSHYIQDHPEMPWVRKPGPQKEAKGPRANVEEPLEEHLQPAIIRLEAKPKTEGVFFDPKVIEESEAKRKSGIEKVPEQPTVPALTEADLKKAEKRVHFAQEIANTETLKEQETRVEKQIREAAKSRSQQNRKPIPRFDPTKAKRFLNWSDQAGSSIAAQPSHAKPNQSLKDESRETDRAELETEVQAAVRAIIPPRGILKRDDPSGVPRVPKKVEFSDEVRERSFKETVTEKTAKREVIDTTIEKQVLREVHDEMRRWNVTGDRFIRLMLIALDDTELPRKRAVDPEKMAIELYRWFLKEAPHGAWTAQAESSIREQLKARTREDALSALEPIIEHFDRYQHPEREKDGGKQIVHGRLKQLGEILHRIGDEQRHRIT
jgi:hypothetical protein